MESRNSSLYENTTHKLSYQRCNFLTFNTDRIAQIRSIYIVTASLDIVLILPTTILNIILIISLYRSSEIRKPSTKLLFSLALSDVLVGLVIEPVYLAKKLAELNYDFDLYCPTGMTTYIAGGALSAVSVLTLTAIAIDRYLVVHTGTKYRSLVTNKRVKLVILAIWITMLTLFSAQLYSPRTLYFKVGAAVMFGMVVIISVCYIKCFLTLKTQRRQAKTLFEDSLSRRCSTLHTYKKSIYTMFYVFLAFILCNLPHACVFVIAGIIGESAAVWAAESICAMGIYANSLVNPILLLWTMSSLRQAVLRTLSRSSKKTHPKRTPTPVISS